MEPSLHAKKAAMNATSDIFHVVVHDVTPQLIEPLTTILDQLAPLVQRAVAAAVVPCWHGQPWDGAACPVAGLIKARCGEVLLHGYTHRRTHYRGAVSLLTGGADEFAGLPAAVAAERLRRGQAALRDLFGAPTAGFVPPAWMPGPVTPGLLAACGLQYSVGFSGIVSAVGARLPLATWSWDLGRCAWAGYLGEAAGVLAFATRRGAIPCIVLHPADVARGYLPHGLHLVRALLAAGRRPATFQEIVSVKESEREGQGEGRPPLKTHPNLS